jgi:hypothetical protein
MTLDELKGSWSKLQEDYTKERQLSEHHVAEMVRKKSKGRIDKLNTSLVAEIIIAILASIGAFTYGFFYAEGLQSTLILLLGFIFSALTPGYIYHYRRIQKRYTALPTREALQFVIHTYNRLLSTYHWFNIAISGAILVFGGYHILYLSQEKTLSGILWVLLIVGVNYGISRIILFNMYGKHLIHVNELAKQLQEEDE